MSGTVQDFLASIGLMLGPIVVFGIYKLRRYSRGIQRAERDALPYDPKPEAQPGVLLHRFSAPEQKYLQQTLGSARFGFLVLSWLTFGIFSLPIFDPWLFNHNSWNNPRVFLWFRILLGATTFVGTSCFLFGIVTAAVVVSTLRFGMTARFFRTRPLGIGFLFWTNLIVTLGSELAAILTGAGTAILLLAAIHGPIWLHLPPAFPGLVTPNNGKQELYASLLATSPPRVLLSVCTTITLSLSVFSVLLAIPYSWRGKLSSGPNVFPILTMALGMCGLMVLNLALDLNDMHLPTWLFVYSELGPPPPYPFALIPIAISACLLCLARYFVGKSEV
jgi:PSP